MAEVTLSTLVDLDLIKMKWRETYVSEGLNRKVTPSTPAGIYQGLSMIENLGGATDRQVEIAPDADTGYHMAVFQSTTGFSLTYWDILGTSIVFDLSDANLDNQETIIAMELDYQIGVDTTADWKAFPIADFDALPAARKADLIILGTVNVPAVDTNITTAMITFNRLSMPWKNSSKGMIAWRQVLKNSSFEYGEVGSFSTQGLPFWVGSGSLITWSRVTFDAVTGSYSVQPNVQAGPFSDSLSQRVGVEALEGQRVLVEFNKKVTFVSTTGTVSIRLTFKDDSGTDLTPLNVVVDDSALDGSFVAVSETLIAPANAAVLDRVEIFMDTMTYSGSGGAILFDDVHVFVETSAATAIANTGEPVDASQVVIRSEDPTVDYDNQNAALLTYDDAAGVYTGGAVKLGNTQASVTPDFHASFITLGDGYTGGTTATLARVTAPPGAGVGGEEFTLMWASVPPGEKGYRKYVGITGTVIETVNADYNNNSNVWGKDINGETAFRTVHSNGQMLYEIQEAGTNSWAEGAWTSAPFTVDSTGILNTDINIAASGALTATTVVGQLNQLSTGVHGDRELILNAAGATTIIDFGVVSGTWGESADLYTGHYISPNNEASLSHSLPLIVGDRIKFVEGTYSGASTASKRLRLRSINNADGVVTNHETITHGVAGWQTQTLTISPEITVVSGRSYFVLWEAATVGDLFGSWKITYDHP
jgi:hypothetical protein